MVPWESKSIREPMARAMAPEMASIPWLVMKSSRTKSTKARSISRTAVVLAERVCSA